MNSSVWAFTQVYCLDRAPSRQVKFRRIFMHGWRGSKRCFHTCYHLMYLCPKNMVFTTHFVMGLLLEQSTERSNLISLRPTTDSVILNEQVEDRSVSRWEIATPTQAWFLIISYFFPRVFNRLSSSGLQPAFNTRPKPTWAHMVAFDIWVWAWDTDTCLLCWISSLQAALGDAV